MSGVKATRGVSIQLNLTKAEAEVFARHIDGVYIFHHARYPKALESALMKARQATMRARSGDQ